MKLTCKTCGKENENGIVFIPGLFVDEKDEEYLKKCDFLCVDCKESGKVFMTVDCSLCNGTKCRDWKYGKDTLESHCSKCPNKV